MSSRNETTDATFFPSIVLAATAAGTPYSQTNSAMVVPYSGTVTRVDYIPSAGITANGTNFQTLNVRNGTSSGAGTTVVASRAWSATNSSANTAEQATLSGTAANLEVKAGDILHVVSSVSGTGVALPAATVVVHIRPRPF